MKQKIQLDEKYKKNIDQAIKILKEGGCQEIYLFGSLVKGNFKEKSDIDLAIKGCPQGKFFHLLGRLMLELDYPVDLIKIDTQNAFSKHLEKEGELLQID